MDTRDLVTGIIQNKDRYYADDFLESALNVVNTPLSNFYQLLNPIHDERGNSFFNSEGYYMAARTNKFATKKRIAEMSKMGGRESRKARKMFSLEMDEHKRTEYMFDAVLKKMQKNDHIAAYLKSTGEQYLVELNYWNDTLFGVCKNRGANVLGQILMCVRNII